ncbi:MAG TPA: septum formation family protein [Nocardioidaceae bacterium]|nr:septum formation family protein [Nocardioidaceae bacterium]
MLVQTMRTTVGAAVAALLLASCTIVEDLTDAATDPSPSAPSSTPAEEATPTQESGPTSSPTGKPSKPPRLPQEAQPPPAKGCYRLDIEAATRPTDDSRPVPCRKRHTAQTVHVGRLDTVVDGHLLAVDSRLAQRQVERGCPRALDRFLGGTEETRRLSRLVAVWFSPTIEQSDLGASWYRCDAVALAGPEKLAPLPPPRRLKGILDRSDALDEIGLCGTTAPGESGFERVICARRHTWQAISTIDISGSAYPGVAAVREAGESTCRDQVREATGSPERFSYGWEWPTRDQWRSGQRYGYCWAPD